MLDREKVVTVLTRRFPGSAVQQIAAAANALVGLDDEWVEVPDVLLDRQCLDGCWLQRIADGHAIRVYRRIGID